MKENQARVVLRCECFDRVLTQTDRTKHKVSIFPNKLRNRFTLRKDVEIKWFLFSGSCLEQPRNVKVGVKQRG
jgi:hypothetical protein